MEFRVSTVLLNDAGDSGTKDLIDRSHNTSRPDVLSCQQWICEFVNNKQMAFLHSFVSQQLLFFYFLNIWKQCRM